MKNICAKNYVYVFVPCDPLDLKFAPLATLDQRYISTKLEVSMTFLFRENQKHETDGRTDRHTDRWGALLNVSPREDHIKCRLSTYDIETMDWILAIADVRVQDWMWSHHCVPKCCARVFGTRADCRGGSVVLAYTIQCCRLRLSGCVPALTGLMSTSRPAYCLLILSFTEPGSTGC